MKPLQRIPDADWDHRNGLPVPATVSGLRLLPPDRYQLRRPATTRLGRADPTKLLDQGQDKLHPLYEPTDTGWRWSGADPGIILTHTLQISYNPAAAFCWGYRAKRPQSPDGLFRDSPDRRLCADPHRRHFFRPWTETTPRPQPISRKDKMGQEPARHTTSMRLCRDSTWGQRAGPP